MSSETWDLVAIKDRSGGAFTSHITKTGKGAIMVGLQYGADPARLLGTLLHEVLEAILTMDERRWSRAEDKPSHIFVFDHDYLNSLGTKLASALVSCGLLSSDKPVKFRSVQTVGDGGEGYAYDYYSKKDKRKRPGTDKKV